MSATTKQFNITIPTTVMPAHVQKFVRIFVGLTVYILTLRMNTECHDEAKAFIEFYMEKLATPIVYESQVEGNESQPSPKFSRKIPLILPSRFNHQSVQPFLPALAKSLNATEEKIGHIRNLIYDCGETANYYVIFGQKFMRDATDFTQSLRKYKDIATHAPFLFVWDLEEIDILCVFCPYAQGAQCLYPLETSSGIQRVIEKDKEINRNMLQTKVQVYGTVGVDELCLPSTNYGFLELISCTVNEIIAKSNATVRFSRPLRNPTEWGDQYVSQIIANLYDGIALTSKNRRRKVPFEWGLVGEFTRETTFVNVVETRGMGMSALWEAFSIQMWLAVLGAALSVAALLTAAYQQMYSSIVDNFKFSVVLVFSLAFNRFDVSGTRVRNSTMLIVLFIFAWAQLSMVLINSYQGYLFSLLASKSLPDVPKDIEGLATTPAFMFSSSYATTLQNKKISFYHYQISELLRMRNRTNDPFGDLLQQMSHRLLFSLSRIDKLIILQATTKSNGTRMSKWDNSMEDLKIPKTHIFVGPLSGVTAYTFTMGILSEPENRRGFVFGKGLPLFLIRLPFFIQTNFFRRVFINRMFGVVQSGIFSLWQRTYFSGTLQTSIKKILDSVENAGVKVKSAGRAFLQLRNQDFGPPKPEEAEQPLTWEFIAGPLQALSLGFALGVIALIFEYAKWLTSSVCTARPRSSLSSNTAVLTVGDAMEEMPEAEENGKG